MLHEKCVSHRCEVVVDTVEKNCFMDDQMMLFEAERDHYGSIVAKNNG